MFTTVRSYARCGAWVCTLPPFARPCTLSGQFGGTNLNAHSYLVGLQHVPAGVNRDSQAALEERV